MALIPASLIAGLGFLFNKTVTIQANTPAPNDFNEGLPVWADLTGHVAIPCVMFPVTGGTVFKPEVTYDVGSQRIILQGWYPLILPKMQAIIGGVTYPINYVEQDSQDLLTQLIVKLVS